MTITLTYPYGTLVSPVRILKHDLKKKEKNKKIIEFWFLFYIVFEWLKTVMASLGSPPITDSNAAAFPPPKPQ